MDKKQYKKFMADLESPDSNATQKLNARDTVLKSMKEKMNLDEEQAKRAKAQLDNKIKQGNLKKTGAIDPRGLVSKGLRAGAGAGSKQIAKKIGKKLLSSIPFVGGAVSAMQSGDASAAIPVLGDSDDTGPKKGSLDSKIEDPSVPMEERKKAFEALKKRHSKKAYESNKE